MITVAEKARDAQHRLEMLRYQSSSMRMRKYNTWEYVHMIQTRCSAIAERPRCRVRYSFRQK